MDQLVLFIAIGFSSALLGIILGYYTRQALVKKRKGTIEAKLEKKILQTKKEAEEIIEKAKAKASKIVSRAQSETENRKQELLKTEKILYKREHLLDERISALEERERETNKKIQDLKEKENQIGQLKSEWEKRLENIADLSKKEAKDQILKEVEEESKKEIIERIKKLNEEGEERFKEKAQEILAQAIQKYALSQAQEIVTTTVAISSEDVKGRIIGKEGRNIRTFEKMTGVELIVDDTPDAVVISSFNPIRRQIAKIALEKLIKDGRIQPARIEDEVEKAKEELKAQIKEFGEKAAYEAGIIDLPPKILEILGRLHFRTSYGQNVLAHSVEVSHLAGALAEEIGANAKVARKAGLLHDIGKAVDQEIQGSHVEIGMRILEKFNIEQEVIDAMKAHHDEYEANSIEAILVKVADQISAARPGARKDTIENYLRRLKDLEDIAKSFSGIKEAYAIQAGREIRVFVKPEEIGDLEAYKMARDIATRIEEELNYPGEIKVNVIREVRAIEYAK